MSKKSCKAAESIEDALLRMARGNSKVIYSGNGRLKNKIFQLRKKTCAEMGKLCQDEEKEEIKRGNDQKG